jgi:hypothetical protein
MTSNNPHLLAEGRTGRGSQSVGRVNWVGRCRVQAGKQVAAAFLGLRGGEQVGGAGRGRGEATFCRWSMRDCEELRMGINCAWGDVRWSSFSTVAMRSFRRSTEEAT